MTTPIERRDGIQTPEGRVFTFYRLHLATGNLTSESMLFPDREQFMEKLNHWNYQGRGIWQYWS